LRRLAVIALCGLAVIGSGCGLKAQGSVHRAGTHQTNSTPHQGVHTRSPATPSPISTPIPSPAPGVDLHSATAVADAEVTATWTVDTTVDTSWYAAELRATAYMTKSYATSIRQNPPASGPGAMWLTWATHQATAAAAITTEDDPGGPIDTTTSAYRKVLATVTPHGTGGWTEPPEVWATFVVLIRSAQGAPWQVSTTETTR